MAATYEAFIYAGAVDPHMSCTEYVCVSAVDGSTGVPGLDLYVTTNGAPSGNFNDPTTVGHINVDGLYYVNVANLSTAGAFTYAATLGFGGPEVASIVVTWLADAIDPCPNWEATPAPVLTAAYTTLAFTDVQLDWTASVSQDSHFWSIEYDVYRSTDAATYSFVGFTRDTLSYVDSGVSPGSTYWYYVQGREPVIGGGYNSNAASPPHTGPPLAGSIDLNRRLLAAGSPGLIDLDARLEAP